MAITRFFSNGTRSIPCLLVGDVAQAAQSYQDRFGFQPAAVFEDPPAALMRRGGCEVLLQAISPETEVGPGGASRRNFADQAWDALFQVDSIDAIARDLRLRGTRIEVGIGITAVSDRTLEVRDDWGNVVAFAETPIGPRAVLRRLAHAAVPVKAKYALHRRLRDRSERNDLRRMREFCGQLAPDPFFMFFTEGLLHWVSQAERHVPKDVNLVLVGSALPDDEVDWLRRNIDRPLHNIGLGVDDNTTWEFLFAANTSNFGYLDIDCFVLAPELFAQMARIGSDVAVNGIWTYDAVPGKPIACTHFAFINLDVARELRTAGMDLTAANYDWKGSNLALLHPRTHCRVPNSRQRQLLLRILPPDERGRPTPPGQSQFFDTLVAYQIGAYAHGYRTHPVRPLAHRTQASLADSQAGQRIWQQDMSPEVVHVGGVSYYRRFFHSPQLRGMYVAAEYAMIQRILHRLPESYHQRAQRLRSELANYHIEPEEAVDLLRRHLIDDRSLPPSAAARILDTVDTPLRIRP